MSILAYATAVRNQLRENLTDFYEGDEESTFRNCKVMVDEHPTADSGQEFIAIYGSYHQPKDKNLMQALEEEFGLTIAVSRKIAVIPPDYRGELGYTDIKNLPARTTVDDSDRWLDSFKSIEARCREIVKLVVGEDRYRIMHEANTLLDTIAGGPITEPLLWLGTDPAPKQVGPEHFYSYADLSPGTDPVFGLVSKIYFGDAIRMQPISDLDRVPS